ncbi:hypothetical protein KY347_03905 [Candidatus Woesearchaeota archaeon]|nr:hypothetical protein [Candidatus Woesearchaeota archaeon]
MPDIIGFDGYYHIKTADIIKKEGVIKEFPWATHTILSDNYADIQLLFRIMLIPFTLLPLALGAKIASVLFAGICFAVFYWFLLQNKIRYAFFWSLVYLFTAESLTYRFLLTREMPIAIALLILTVYFLQQRKYLFLGITSFVFALFYSGFVFQLLIIFSYFILEKIFSKKFDCKIAVYSLAGTILGLVINPYFPNNIFMLYTQIVKVNLIANLYNVEWKPWPFLEFIKNNVVVLFCLLTSIFVLFKNKKITKAQSLYFSLALFFFFYTLISRRMQEYLVPFSILAIAFILSNTLYRLDKNKFLGYIKAGAVIFLIVLVAANFAILRKDIINNNFLYNYDSCAEWMANNIPKNSLVFNNAYAFPYLFFKNSELRYTHGIDLTYSYLYNPEEFERYMGILQGTLKSDTDFIIKDYAPEYVFSGKVKQDTQLFNYIVKHKENYKAVYEDRWCAVLKAK